MKLNTAQEKYAQLRAKGVDPSEGYKQCWAWENSSAATIATNAKHRDQNPKIAARIAEIKAEIMNEIRPELVVTVESLLEELEEAKHFAKECENPSAFTQAIMGKAKIAGLDKKVVEIQAQEELTPWAALSAGVDSHES